MAILTVTTIRDVVDENDGRMSLREAVAQANAAAPPDTIVFAAALEGDTLTLTGGELVLRQDVTIDGDRNNDGIEVTISGADAQRILRTSGSGTDVTLRDLTLTDGLVQGNADGGAIFVGGGSLILDGSTVRDSVSGYDGNGGGIYASQGSRVTIANSAIVGNVGGGLYYLGGGIAGNNTTLVVRNSSFDDNIGGGGGGAIVLTNGSSLSMEDSTATGNGRAGFDALASGGAIWLLDSSGTVARSTLADNIANFGGALRASNSRLVVTDSTIANNIARHEGFYSPSGGGVFAGGNSELVVRNTTITDNVARIDDPSGPAYIASGGGIHVGGSARLDIANSIVAGNAVVNGGGGAALGPDISGTIALSNGHNVFGSDVVGNDPGDRENIAASAIFAAIDPGRWRCRPASSRCATTSPTRPSPAPTRWPPALVGQLGTTARPQPAGSLPDIGSIEINQPLSTTASPNNDVLTGTAGIDTLSGQAGNDYLKGLGGGDRLNGGAGSDLLDGGAGNDELDGDAGIDLVTYASGTAAVVVDLGLGTATRGGETDTLTEVEGAIGSSKADTFKGDGSANWFQGGFGRDLFTGGGGRDLYDFNAGGRERGGRGQSDVINDFVHLTDDIDLMGIDADATIAGDQAFTFVGDTALTGAGQVGLFFSGGNTIVRFSTDADAASEGQIHLNGMKTLSVEDFYL